MAALAFTALAFTASCSDPVPPASDGGFFVKWRSQPTNGAQCNTNNVLDVSVGQVSPSGVGELEQDSIRGAQISCDVVASGGSFSASGAVSVGADYLTFTIESISADATEAAPATGVVRYFTPQIGAPFQSPPDIPCHFFFRSNGQEVDSGRIYVDFVCDAIGNASQNRSCGIERGIIAVQNCSS